MFAELRQLLLANAELAAVISGVYPGSVPESKSLPALSAFIVSESLTDAMDDTPTAMVQQNWQVNVVANTAMDAAAIAGHAVTALHKQTGDGISYALVTSRRDDPPPAGGTVHSVMIETTITQQKTGEL